MIDRRGTGGLPQESIGAKPGSRIVIADVAATGAATTGRARAESAEKGDGKDCTPV
jgi:hypothetical protein